MPSYKQFALARATLTDQRVVGLGEGRLVESSKPRRHGVTSTSRWKYSRATIALNLCHFLLAWHPHSLAYAYFKLGRREKGNTIDDGDSVLYNNAIILVCKKDDYIGLRTGT